MLQQVYVQYICSVDVLPWRGKKKEDRVSATFFMAIRAYEETHNRCIDLGIRRSILLEGCKSCTYEAACKWNLLVQAEIFQEELHPDPLLGQNCWQGQQGVLLQTLMILKVQHREGRRTDLGRVRPPCSGCSQSCHCYPLRQ